MDSLFIGHSYVDVTFVTDVIPTGDDKALAKDYSFGVGGNSMVAAFTCAKLGNRPDLMIPVANDWLGDMLMAKCARAGIRVLSRGVGKTSVSLVLPNNGKRAVLRSRDANYTTDFPKVSIDGYKALHVDGHQMDAAIEYAKKFREAGKLTSFDGGAVRPGTEGLLPYLDVAAVSMRFCEQLQLSAEDTLQWLLERGVKIPAVTLGEDGMVFIEDGKLQKLAAIPVPAEKVVDSTGAGDIFHGTYLFSYLRNPQLSWREHFKFARAASALSIQCVGTESSIPELADIEALAARHANLD